MEAKTSYAKILAKIVDIPTLQEELINWKQEDKKIVFTNGCFDILHKGHITYLAQAADLGHKLIVGVNSDASIQKLKGKQRPILSQEDRLLQLAALEFVDKVIVFGEDTSIVLINSILPDVLVKGGDYIVENIVGYKEVIQNNGQVKVIPLIEGYSTTTFLQRIQQMGL